MIALLKRDDYIPSDHANRVQKARWTAAAASFRDILERGGFSDTQIEALSDTLIEAGQHDGEITRVWLDQNLRDRGVSVKEASYWADFIFKAFGK